MPLIVIQLNFLYEDLRAKMKRIFAERKSEKRRLHDLFDAKNCSQRTSLTFLH